MCLLMQKDEGGNPTDPVPGTGFNHPSASWSAAGQKYHLVFMTFIEKLTTETVEASLRVNLQKPNPCMCNISLQELV